MNILERFDDYVLSLITEAINGGKISLVLSMRLRNLLYGIKHPIARAIIGAEVEGEPEYKVSYLDIDDSKPGELDRISYLVSTKAIEILKSKYGAKGVPSSDDHEQEDIGMYMNKKPRSSSRIGRVVKKLFADKFRPSGAPGEDIESFVSMYKAARDVSDFEIVSGNDVRYWYNESHYMQGEGDLNGSCMRYDRCDDYLKFYSMNDKIVSLLILKDKDDKKRIRGRALVWNLYSPSGRTFMDRIYFVQGYEVDLFKRYAEERNWMYKNRQNMNEDEGIVDPMDGTTRVRTLLIEDVSIPEDEIFPYMDTMKYLNIETADLTNDFEQIRWGGSVYKLTGTEGNDFEVFSINDDQWESNRGGNISEEDVLNDLRRYAFMYPNTFWDCVDSNMYMDSLLELETEYYYGEFEDAIHPENAIDALISYIDSADVELPLKGTNSDTATGLRKEMSQMTTTQIKEILEENGILYDVARTLVEKRYGNMTPRDVCDELYVGCEDVTDDVFDAFWDTLDQECFVQDVIYNHNG